MLSSIFTSTGTDFTASTILFCSLASVALGVAVALVHMFRNRYSKSFVITLALLPLVIQSIIMLVNGNLGTGLAVLGAFSLIRFRSVPGTSREIGSIFFAMAVGLATGMGYLTFAALFAILYAMVSIALILLPFGVPHNGDRLLKILIPESMDYTTAFDEVFRKYTRNTELLRVKSTHMGSLFELQYRVVVPDPLSEKKFLDELRVRNENLEVFLGQMPVNTEEL